MHLLLFYQGFSPLSPSKACEENCLFLFNCLVKNCAVQKTTVGSQTLKTKLLSDLRCLGEMGPQAELCSGKENRVTSEKTQMHAADRN